MNNTRNPASRRSGPAAARGNSRGNARCRSRDHAQRRPDYGSIRAGKAADLVLLEADPTVDIANTIKIARVMRAGRWVE
jgi:imidazolonepropionase-like amidohydrolase